MIFSFEDHVQQIISGKKTQTRRKSDWYQVGQTYSIQEKRAKPAIPEGRILITHKRIEEPRLRISSDDALAEGGYDPGQFEALYSQMYPGWDIRYAYTFEFKPTKETEEQ